MSTNPDLSEIHEELQTIKDQLSLEDDQTALNVAILNELKKINDKLSDIEVHTNNTVRKM